MQQIRVMGIVAIVIVVVAGLFIWRNAGRVPLEELDIAPNIDGPADAPVKVVEYGDFGCPSCRAWHNAGVKNQLKAEFGEQVSFEFRHFPVITPQSPKAAEAGQCAAEQNAFWDFHDYVYEQTPPGALGRDNLKSYAAAVGLDQAAFDSCLDSNKYETYVFNDAQAARNDGARGTPTFLINGQQVFPTYAAMVAVIQEILDS